jgi:hypothetical protein
MKRWNTFMGIILVASGILLFTGGPVPAEQPKSGTQSQSGSTKGNKSASSAERPTKQSHESSGKTGKDSLGRASGEPTNPGIGTANGSDSSTGAGPASRGNTVNAPGGTSSGTESGAGTGSSGGTGGGY